MKPISQRSAALSVAGIFLSISIIAGVLSCALWDFQVHSRRENVLYAGGLIISLLLNFLIAASLVQGVRFNMANLLLPYLVCASFHFLVSSVGGVYLATVVVSDLLASRVSILPACLLAACISLALFWLGSIGIVWKQRKMARKFSGQHLLFVDSDMC